MTRISTSLRWTATLAVALSFTGLAITQPTAALADNGGSEEGSVGTAAGSSTTNCCWPWL
jgi:hypothetical protein